MLDKQKPKTNLSLVNDFLKIICAKVSKIRATPAKGLSRILVVGRLELIIIMFAGNHPIKQTIIIMK